MSDGTSFQIDIGVQGAAAVEGASNQVASLADKLTGASDAASKQVAAIAEAQAAYSKAESAANRAAMAVERIGLAADAQRGKLAAATQVGDEAGAARAAQGIAALVAQQDLAQAKADAAAAAMNEQAATLDRLTASAAAASASETSLAAETQAAASAEKEAADTMSRAAAAVEKFNKVAATTPGAVDETSKSAFNGTGNMRALSSAFGKLGGPIGIAGQQAAGFAGAVQKMSKAIGSAGPYVAAGVVFVALAAGIAVATIAMTKFAITSADAARTSALLSAGIAGSVAGGVLLDKSLDNLLTKVPQSREDLTSMASELAKTGLKGDALSAALETAAVKAAKLKWGPDFQKQMLSLDNQSARFKSNITRLFSGVNIEGFLSGLSKVVGLFDVTSASGKAIKVVFESLFQPIVDGVTAMLPKVTAAFIRIEIWAMKALIAIKPYASKIVIVAEAFGLLAAVVGGVLLVGMALVGAAVLAITIALGALIQAVIAVGSTIYDFGASVVDTLQGISLDEIGSAMIDGLVNGITGEAGAVVAALTGVVSSGIDAAKQALGIASPSKVFAEIGDNTVAGMTGSLDAGTGAVQSAMGDMVAPPEPAGASGTTGSSGGSSANLAGATFNFYGVKDAEDAESRFSGILTRILEGDVAQLGGAVPNAT